MVPDGARSVVTQDACWDVQELAQKEQAEADEAEKVKEKVRIVGSARCIGPRCTFMTAADSSYSILCMCGGRK